MNNINIEEVAVELLSGKNNKQEKQELVAKDIYTAEELFNMKIKEIPFLWQNLIPQTGLACLTGSSDSNKSTLLRQLALEIAIESDDCLGFKLNAKHNKVIYVSTEDDANSIAALLSKQYFDGLPIEALRNIRFLFNTEKHIQSLDKMLTEQKADLVIVDTWTDLFGGDINQSNKVRASFEEYKKLSLKHGCAFIFVHHQGKSSEGNAPSKNNLLGSQGIEAKMRTVIELRRDTGSRRLMTITKGNYTADSIKGKSFVLELTEKHMIFERKDESVNLAAQIGLIAKYDKEEIMKISIPLRAKDVSYEKILIQLKEKFGENVPALTTLKNWFPKQSGSQSPSK
jgi:RecA-family ATPase